MVVVKAVHCVEIVADQEDDACPFEATWSLQPEDDHEHTKFHQEHRLKDHVVAEKADRVIVFIQIRQICFDLLGRRVYTNSFLEAMIHQWQPGHEKVLLRAHIRVNAILLVMANVLGLGCYLVLLKLRSALALSFSLKLAIVVQLDIECLLSILIQELALIPRVLFCHQLLKKVKISQALINCC